MGWPSTVNFSKERRVAPALPRPAGGVWAISKAGHIDSPATAQVITSRFISVSGIRAMLQSRFGGHSTVWGTPGYSQGATDGLPRLFPTPPVSIISSECERMQIVEREVRGVTILDLTGRFVLEDGVTQFVERMNALTRQGRRRILVNFENVTYLDSAGVGAVAWKYVTVRKRGGDVKLLN